MRDLDEGLGDWGTYGWVGLDGELLLLLLHLGAGGLGLVRQFGELVLEGLADETHCWLCGIDW